MNETALFLFSSVGGGRFDFYGSSDDMAVSTRLLPPCSLSFLRLPPTRRPIRFSSSAAPPPPSPSPVATRPHRCHRTPLFLRPLAHSASPADLKAFHSWAASLAVYSTSAHFSHPSDPEPAHLLRELRWLLQDASTGSSFDPHYLFSSSASSSLGDATDPVPLRVGLGELYGLWRERVEERRPLQYLVGCEHWRDLVLVVREGVLIPRPETEALVDMVAEVVAAAGQEGGGDWADLGTGSGALAVGIARVLGEGKGGKVYATDVSSDAIEVARINLQRYGLEDKVEIRQGSWFKPLHDVKGKLAGLVSNPPYIPSSHILGLQAEVSRHEPRLALDGGENGMDHLLHLCEGSSLALRPGGFFAFETNGDEQSEFIAEFMNMRWGTYFTDIKIVSDFVGVKRFVTGFHQ